MAQIVSAVICAAGESKRFGEKKEYQRLAVSGKESITVLGAVVGTFAMIEEVQTIAIAIPPNDEDVARAALPSQLLNIDKPKIIFVNGGKARQASVYNALSALAPYKPDYVLIHDGARPWVSASLIQSVITAAFKYDAAIPLLPLAETPKETGSGDNVTYIKTHLKRKNTGVAQTPQGFKFPEILHAHEKALKEEEEFTDDAEIWGKFCGKVAVVKGEAENRKITFREDLSKEGLKIC